MNADEIFNEYSFGARRINGKIRRVIILKIIFGLIDTTSEKYYVSNGLIISARKIR
jgi:hypothetical protein